MKSTSRSLFALIALAAGGTLIFGLTRFGVLDSRTSQKSSAQVYPSRAAPAKSELPDVKPEAKMASRLHTEPMSNWEREFYKTNSLFPLVKRAALAAIKDKDGRAAYFVSQSLSACAAVYRSAQRDPNFEASFDSAYAKMAPKAPEWARAKDRREFDRCVQMAKEDPFTELPTRTDGYRQSAYWQDLALANSDPLAEAHQALLDMADANSKDADSRAPIVQEAQRLISDVAKSGDPAAIFVTGQLLTNARNSADPLRGVAISLAACDLGYDCSANNPANVFAVCADSGACPANADYAYFMQQSLGPQQFATAYSKAQSFKDLIARGDWNGVASFITLDGALMSKN